MKVWRHRILAAIFLSLVVFSTVGVNGEMLDRPHLLRAERLLRRAGKHQADAPEIME